MQNQASDYKRVNHQNLTETDFNTFFKNGKYTLTRFPNLQVFDQTGLIGRAFSSSYVPAEETPEGAEFLDKLKEIFNRHENNGTVSVEYQTEIYLGEVTPHLT